jgi:hypothetical protein
MAYASIRAVKLLEKRSREQMPSVYATLGGSINPMCSSPLIAKYYSRRPSLTEPAS